MGRRSWVDPLFVDPGGVTTDFAVTFQEPSLALLKTCRKVLADKFGEASEPFVNGLEVSVDFTPKVMSDDARSRMVGVLSRHLLPNRDVLTRKSNRPRFSWGTSRSMNSYTMGLSREQPLAGGGAINVFSDKPAPVDATYYVGNKRANAMWRVMDKVIDRQNDGTSITLSEGEKRARVEVKMDHLELRRIGLQTLGQLMIFNFARLQGSYFKFMLPTFPIRGHSSPPADRYWEPERMRRFLNVGVIGLQAMDQWRTKERKKNRAILVRHLKARGIAARPPLRQGAGHSGNLVAYQDLNDRVSLALRKLVEREKRGIGL